MKTPTRIQAALIAAILASAGGAAFLQKHPDPTLRDVFQACEAGDLAGMACCEDLTRIGTNTNVLEACGAVHPSNPDPFGIRGQLEKEWDAKLKAEQAAQN